MFTACRLLPIQEIASDHRRHNPLPPQHGSGLPINLISRTCFDMLFLLYDHVNADHPDLQVKKYDEKKTTFLDLTGLTNSLCIIKFADEELTSSSTPPILEIWTIGKRLNWDPANPLKQRIWRKSQASDQSWLKAFLAEELAKLMPALQKIETVWDDPSVMFQGVLPINRMVENRTCNDYNFSSPGFDYLRVFYNDTGWETLFPEPTTMPFNMPEIVPICSGHKIMPSPWIVYSKQKDLLSKAAGVIGSGVNSGEPVMYNIREAGVSDNTTEGMQSFLPPPSVCLHVKVLLAIWN